MCGPEASRFTHAKAAHIPIVHICTKVNDFDLDTVHNGVDAVEKGEVIRKVVPIP